MLRHLFSIALLVSASLTHAPASVLFSNVTGNNAPDSGSGIDLGSTCCSVAFGFTTPAGNDYTFTGIDIAIGGTPGAVVVVSLLADSNGVPGNVLQSFTFSDIVPVEYNSLPPLQSAVSNAGILLTGDSQYWVSVFNPVGSAGWVVNSNGFHGPEYIQIGGSSSPWGVAGGVNVNVPEGAFRVNGDVLPTTAAIPEPNSFLTLGFGVLTLVGIVIAKALIRRTSVNRRCSAVSA